MRATLGRLMLLATVAAMPNVAFAQNQSVSQRAASTEGVRLGGFMLYPTLTAEVLRNDNVFAVDRNEIDDTIFTVTPSLDLRSNWSVHELGASLRAVSRTYDAQSDQDSFDIFPSIDGRLDITADDNLFGNLAYVDSVEPLTEAPTVGLVEPTEFTSLSGAIGGRIGFNRLTLIGRVGFSEFDYEDGRLASRAIVDQDNRDRTTTDYTIRAEYETGPGTFLFASASVNDRNYDQERPAVAFDRDSDGYEVLGGVAMDLTNLVRGEIGLGYFEQNFADRAFQSVDGVSIRGQVEWFLTPILTITGNATRGVNDAGVAGASSIVQSTYGVRADYEFRRNLVFNTGVNLTSDEYRGIAREDERVNFSLGALYRLNDIVGVTGSYALTTQESTGTARGKDYDQNVLSIGLRLAL